MKKLVLIILCLSVCALFVGCKTDTAGVGGQTEDTAASDVSSAFQTPPTSSGDHTTVSEIEPPESLTSSEAEVRLNELVERFKDREKIPFAELSRDEHLLLFDFNDREDVKEILEKIDYGEAEGV